MIFFINFIVDYLIEHKSNFLFINCSRTVLHTPTDICKKRCKTEPFVMIIPSPSHFTCLLVLPPCQKHTKPRVINFDPLNFGGELKPYQKLSLLSIQKQLNLYLQDIENSELNIKKI